MEWASPRCYSITPSLNYSVTLFAFMPVMTDSTGNFERDPERNRRAHQLQNARSHLVQLRFRNLEYQFVMHLQQHTGPAFARFEIAMNVDHCDLDDVRGTALHRCVLSGAFTEA